MLSKPASTATERPPPPPTDASGGGVGGGVGGDEAVDTPRLASHCVNYTPPAHRDHATTAFQPPEVTPSSMAAIKTTSDSSKTRYNRRAKLKSQPLSTANTNAQVGGRGIVIG